MKKKIIGASEKSFEILFNMIMGIQIAVQAIPNFKIKNRDDMKKYLTSMLYSIQTVYLGKENEKIYLLKEFGGVIFNNIRIYFGINKESFIKSISPQDFVTELMISFQTILKNYAPQALVEVYYIILEMVNLLLKLYQEKNINF